MTSCRFVFACLLFLAAPLLLATPFVAAAGQGDPRLVTGVLEWPPTLTNEAFVIVRGDDGVLYYVGVASARRDVPPTSSMRVAVLGIEGRSPHEITAAALGSGATSDAALAQLQAPRAATAAPAAVPAPAPSGTAAVAPAHVQSGTAAVAPPPAPSGTAAVAPPAHAGPTVSGAAAGAPPASVPNQAAPPASAASPAAPAATPPVSGSSPAPAAVPPADMAAKAPAAATRTATAAPAPAPPAPDSTAVTPAAVVATAPMVPVDEKRWTELVGEVERFVGRTLILRVDGGRVSVDTSALSGNLERMVAPGSKVKVYGVPVELRFKALGFIDPDARGRGR